MARPKLVDAVRRTHLFRVIGRLTVRACTIEVTESEKGRGASFEARLGMIPMGRVTLAVQDSSDAPRQSYWLMALKVRPVFRRMGIARLLCRKLMRRAEEAGAASLKLTVREDNVSAIRLYESLGFERMSDLSTVEYELKRLETLTGARYMAMQVLLNQKR